MKITIYELIGLIKDNKAPKKIKYNNEIWKYDDELKTYDNDDYDRDLLEKLFYESYILDFINDEVEIIEENNIKHCEGRGNFLEIEEYIEHLKTKIDDLIDKVNKLKEK